MATPAKRITRLRARELPVRAATEKELKPEKAVTTSKNSKKVNVSARVKSLRVSKANVSVKKNQITPRRLRPRQNRKAYFEDSRLLERYILPKQQDSVVVLEKLNEEEGKKKVPVYKTTKSSEKSSEGNDVYDFKFDANDTREKAKKKQKKRNVNKGKGKVSKKTTRKKVTVQLKKIDRKVIGSPEPEGHSVEIAQSEPPLEFAVVAESTRKDIGKKIDMSEINVQIVKESKENKDVEKDIEQPSVEASVQIIENSTEIIAGCIETSKADTNIQDETTLRRSVFAKQVRKENASKPKIISIENANDIIITKSPSNNTEDLQPFRPKNIFDNKTSFKESNSTLKNSLLMKTLSPIQKNTTSIFDTGSPWRPPTLMFSQTKYFIQSTPYKNLKKNKEIKKINKMNAETNKENVKMKKEDTEVDKENMDKNKENKGQRDKERKKKTVSLRKKQLKLPMLKNKAPEKAIITSSKHKSDMPAPARVSLGEIKNFLQRPNVNGDNKQQTIEQAHTEVDKSLGEETNKQLADYLNFSDTFDVLSETEKLSNIGNDAPLFMDLEPTHFSKPPQHSYKRTRAVRFDFSGGSDEEQEEKEKENIKSHPKKKKLTKSEKEQEKRINEWIKTVNTTFQEIDDYTLLIE